ncbi:MAG: HAMP domain-containing sensor histidine kinase, partial [Gemmatimonadaceae bacterium]
ASVGFVVVAAMTSLSPVVATAIVAGLLASSLLAGRATSVVHRVVATEVARLEMEHQVVREKARVAEARAASAAREQVLRVVAHDLRNPLSTILMSADLLAEDSMGPDARKAQGGVVKRAGARMNRLIRDLLDVARMEGGRLTVDVKPVSPAALLASALEMMEPLAREHFLSIGVECADAVPLVNADVERISQVFSNLVGNAIKFTPAGGTITLRAEEADGSVWFSVTDTGPGMPPEQLERVFGPFWQANSGDRRGIGLGLTIAKGIVEAHGGKIGVSSDVGVGTKFWFCLR